MSAPLLRLTQITKSFGAVRALKGVSFELYPGEVYALLGENGAGKSTLIKVITGAHMPDGGTLEIAGAQVRDLTPTKARSLGIACIYQQPALFPELSVAENIGLRLECGATFERVDWKKLHSNALHFLNQIGAVIDPETLVRSLSMPQQQLVEIACALGSGAKTVIMDEPTASLTRTEQELLFGVVRTLKASGAGIVYISHRLEEIFALADRVTVLRDGESISTQAVRGSEGTVQISETELIGLMVGRPVNALYPAKAEVTGKPVLELRGVGCKESGIQAWVFALGALFFCLLVHRTTMGRSFRAIGFSTEGALYAGIPVQRHTTLPYVLSGLVAALAALLFTARLHQARADAGTGYELAAITAVVLGGASIFGGSGSLHGTLIGIAAIAVLNNGISRVPAVLRAGVGGELASMLTGALLLIALAAPILTRFITQKRGIST